MHNRILTFRILHTSTSTPEIVSSLEGLRWHFSDLKEFLEGYRRMKLPCPTHLFLFSGNNFWKNKKLTFEIIDKRCMITASNTTALTVAHICGGHGTLCGYDQVCLVVITSTVSWATVKEVLHLRKPVSKNRRLYPMLTDLISTRWVHEGWWATTKYLCREGYLFRHPSID